MGPAEAAEKRAVAARMVAVNCMLIERCLELGMKIYVLRMIIDGDDLDFEK